VELPLVNLGDVIMESKSVPITEGLQKEELPPTVTQNEARSGMTGNERRANNKT
jgi:hypothetical protein